MIKALLAIVAAVAVAAVLALPAGAHTAMLRASPDRNATVGGSIGIIDLEFLEPVTDASVTVTYNGAPMAGRTTVPNGQLITFTFDQPLAQPGRYQVSYEMTSFDGDFTTDGYFFSFDPAAAQPARIELSESGGLPVSPLALAVAGLLVVVVLLALYAWRIDSRRRRQTLEAASFSGAGEGHHPHF